MDMPRCLSGALCLVTSGPIGDPGRTTRSDLWPEEATEMPAVPNETWRQSLLAACVLSWRGPWRAAAGGGRVHAVAGYRPSSGPVDSAGGAASVSCGTWLTA